jgi:predicted lipid-binding transport protein (Tim44 family)
VTQPRRPTSPQRPTRPPLARPFSAREQVLARRRYALLGLAGVVLFTLILAIITGSVLLLIINVLTGVALAGYIAMLLHIKQTQQAGARASRPPVGDPEKMEATQRR